MASKERRKKTWMRYFFFLLNFFFSSKIIFFLEIKIVKSVSRGVSLLTTVVRNRKKSRRKCYWRSTQSAQVLFLFNSTRNENKWSNCFRVEEFISAESWVGFRSFGQIMFRCVAVDSIKLRSHNNVLHCEMRNLLHCIFFSTIVSSQNLLFCFNLGPCGPLFGILFIPSLFASMITTTLCQSIEHFCILDWLASLPGLSQQIGRESWVGFTVASWLYKMERLPSHADNWSTRCPFGAPWSSYQSCLD